MRNSLADIDPMTQHAVLGVLCGYLFKSRKMRVSLDPRSCKLLGFFAQVNGPSGIPFILGEEDEEAEGEEGEDEEEDA